MKPRFSYTLFTLIMLVMIVLMGSMVMMPVMIVRVRLLTPGGDQAAVPPQLA